MAENIVHYSSSNYDLKYHDQSFVTYFPIYSQPPWNYYNNGFASACTLAPIPYHFLHVPPADVLGLARHRMQEFADYLCQKYIKTETRLVEKPNWLDLPDDITADILHRLGAYEILKNAQKVCKAWRTICQDPAMWRVIYMECSEQLSLKHTKQLQEMCMQAIDRSQGQLVDISIERIANDELLKYLAEGKRSSQLKRFQISWSSIWIYNSWMNFFQKSPLLEEISVIYSKYISIGIMRDVGQYCVKLKSLKYHQELYKVYYHGPSEFEHEDEFVRAITKSMPQLRHLELVGSEMTNTGLQAILDGCPHLEYLDLRRCFNINLESSCGKLCMDTIKYLRLPYDLYMEDHKHL